MSKLETWLHICMGYTRKPRSASKYQSWCLCRLHRFKLSRLEGFCYLIHSNQSSILLVCRSWFNTIPRRMFSPSENPHRISLESPLLAPRSYIFKSFKQMAVYLCVQNYQQVSRSSHQSLWPFQSCKQRHLRPVRPASPWGPPMMNLPEGLMCKCLQRKTWYRWRAKGKNRCLGKKLLASNTTSAKRTSTICNKKASRNLHFITHILRKARGVLAGCNDMNLWRVLFRLSRISPTHPWCSDEWQLFLLLYPSILYWLNVCDTRINAELCTYIAHERWCSWLYLPTLWTAKWNYKANSIEDQLLSVSEIVELFRPQFAWSKCILPVSKQLNFTYISHKPIHEIIPVKVRVAAVEW